MERQPQALREPFDVLIIGGGVTGVVLARTLARAGLRTALVERDDFGGATTHNSLKIVHGGLRYIQRFDVPRIRESIRSQNAWLAAAPNLVSPMRFTMATRGWGARGPVALALGMTAYRTLGGRRDPQLRRMSVGGRRGFRRDFPEIAAEGTSGYAAWFDAQIRDSGRLLTECVADAARAGAVMINHAEAERLLAAGGRVEGAGVRDLVSGQEHEVRARLTVTALGPWTPHFLARAVPGSPAPGASAWTRNMNVVLKRPVVSGGAVSVLSRQPGDGLIGKASRLYFITPWQGTSIVGTTHDSYRDNPDALGVDEDTVASFLSDVATALGGRSIGLDDVAYLHLGVSPAEEEGHYGARRALVMDEREHGMKQLVAITANKYTTAPEVAKRVAADIPAALGTSIPAWPDFAAPLPFAQDAPDPLRAVAEGASPDERELAWVRAVYGAHLGTILQLAGSHDDADPAIRLFKARVEFGVRQEMACRLGDAIFRCTDLAERGRLSQAELDWAAAWMGERLGWPEARKQQEHEAACRRLRRHMSGGPGMNWGREPAK